MSDYKTFKFSEHKIEFSYSSAARTSVTSGI